ncbi:MAG: hypothetical protein HOP24_09145 [Sideroxydans sp.]|nr:hypothetical protein [Sideroxydans sp.]
MSKAKIDRVAYVGWRGIVGCEVLELDEELTALVGPTGAGKSTLVMCMDYAILPDRRTMEIRPISDVQDIHNAGTDTLAARIDPAYGYAYVVLGITMINGKKLIAGIHVSTVDGHAHFTRWLIRDVPENSLLQDLLSIQDGESEYYPDFPELKRHLAGNGVYISICGTIGEYCQALYEAGVLPSSMTSGTDRTLYAKLIESTFKGGISEEIATNLKGYLLPVQSQVQELVRGLQECTNDVIKTRSAVADAKNQLNMLKSTYGVGKDAVMTALKGIEADVSKTEREIEGATTFVSTKHEELIRLDASIPRLVEQIEVAEQLKKSAMENGLHELQLLGDQKETLSGTRNTRKTTMDETAKRLKEFNAGCALWRKVAGALENDGYDDVKAAQEKKIEGLNRSIYGIEKEMHTLQDEDERLSMDRSSSTSEHLAELLGGQTLEQSLGRVSEKESVALEMTLGGLTEGVVGVDFGSLASIPATDDIPNLFWLGEKTPSPRPIRESGDWYLLAAADGYIVSSKKRASVFGNDARKLRRVAIAEELEILSGRLGIQIIARDKEQEKLTEFLKNDGLIKIFLENRQDVFAIDRAAKNAKKEWELADAALKTAEIKYLTLQADITKIGEPHERILSGLRTDLSSQQGKRPFLVKEIEDSETSLLMLNKRMDACRLEETFAKEILGCEFARFWATASESDFPTQNVEGLQTRRMLEVSKALGEENQNRFESFRDFDAANRVSIVRMWPDLMKVIQETISIDIVDKDGEDLIEAMQIKRAHLDSDLALQENELDVKANSISLSINTAVRTQRNKIDKLSKLGHTICFGNVNGIRLQLVPRTNMLEVLEQFADQLSLLSKEKPVDQVLKDFFDAASSVRIRMDGASLLDYREYVDLVIETKREEGDWELASSLSGGESIGCGLAIALMLTRSIANRGEAGGEGVKTENIRPLYGVDEISRLDAAGQKVLVDFAKRERFQLLFAAPELKPSYNCTLYNLKRIFTPEARLIIRASRYRPQLGMDAA